MRNHKRHVYWYMYNKRSVSDPSKNACNISVIYFINIYMTYNESNHTEAISWLFIYSNNEWEYISSYTVYVWCKTVNTCALCRSFVSSGIIVFLCFILYQWHITGDRFKLNMSHIIYKVNASPVCLQLVPRRFVGSYFNLLGVSAFFLWFRWRCIKHI